MFTFRSLVMDPRAKRQVARIADRDWEVALYLPPIRVRVTAESEDDACRAATSLAPDAYAEALVRRLQFTRPRPGDVIGAHPFVAPTQTTVRPSRR